MFEYHVEFLLQRRTLEGTLDVHLLDTQQRWARPYEAELRRLQNWGYHVQKEGKFSIGQI